MSRRAFTVGIHGGHSRGDEMTEVDYTGLRFNQFSIILLITLGWLLDIAVLPIFVGLVMLVGTIRPRWSLFKSIYRDLLRPLGLLKPDLVNDQIQPHLFSQGLGAIVLLVATAAFLSGMPMLGWGLGGIVIFLASINLIFRFCVGCFLYYQLTRRGIGLDLPLWRPTK